MRDRIWFKDWRQPSAIQYRTVDLTDAEIKLLVDPAKELIPAPGVGKFIEVVSAKLILKAGTEILAESTDNLVIGYNDGTVAIGETIETSTFIVSATNAITNWFGKKDDTVADISTIVNKNVALLNNSGNFTGCASGDSALTVKIAYRIHTTDL